MKTFLLVSVAIATAAAGFPGGSAQAADLWWDGGTVDISGVGDGLSAGGAGTWDLTIRNWDAGASPHVAWVNANNDTAIFGGDRRTATVTLGTGITVGGLSFDTAGYSLTGGSLTFGIAGSIAGNWCNQTNATISSVLAGSAAVTKKGSGTVLLNGPAANAFTGGLVLNGGTLLADFANLGTPTDLIPGANTLTFGGGTLSVKGRSSGTTLQNLSNVTVNAGGGRILGDRNGGTSTTISLGTLTATASGGSLLVGAGGTAANAPVITTASDKDAATGIHGGRVVFFNGTANTGYDWATTDSVSGPYTLTAYSGYTTLPTSGGSSSVNYNMTAATTLADSFSIHTLKLQAPGGDLALGANTLTVEGGGVLFTGTTARNLTGTAGATRLTAGSGSGSYDLIVHQCASAALTISAVIGDNGANAVSLVKAGPGTLTLSGANTYSGDSYANAGTLNFAGIALGGFGGGSGRNIHVAAGAAVRRDALNNDFLNRLVETGDEIGVFTGTTANNLDFSSGTGANLPNAFLGNWAGNGAKAEYSGTLTPASDAYRFGFPGAAGTLGIVSTLADIGGTPKGVIVGGNVVELTGANTFTGDTVIRTGGRLFLGKNLCLQNSALDLGDAGSSLAGLLSLETGTGAGPITGVERTDHPTLGGLKGSRNFASVITTANANNTGRLTVGEILGLTLNPGAGKTCVYTGAITEMATGTYLVKTGAGTQTLAGTNTYTGPTTVSNGTLLVHGSLAAASTVIVHGGALGGTGLIGGPTTVNSGGAIAPGASVGTLTVQNDVIWNAGTAWNFDLGLAGLSMAAPGISDLLNIAGVGSDFLKGSGGGWAFDFGGTGEMGWYKLVDWEGTSDFDSGDFTATNLPNGASGSFTKDDETTALYLNVVPEPSSLGLMGLWCMGLLGRILLHRRR